jgi:dihydroorotate dehydrogenase
MSVFGVIRPALFALSPERAHTLTLAALRTGLLSSMSYPVKGLAVDLFGLRFPNPVGLAAGFDKNAVASRAMLKLGFGFVEAGSVTPNPQRGNSKPRVFRLPQDRAVINRLGFNNEGHDVFARNLEDQRLGHPGIIGVNIGANKDSADPIEDYVTGVLRFAAIADYFVVNISSPNTPGLRDFQARGLFHDLLTRVGAARDRDAVRPPLLVKIAETGGLSGRPLFAMSTGVLRDTYRISEGRLPLVGVGGIASGEDAYAKIKAGASLIQLYTGLIYQGPGLVQSILRDLRGLLDRDGVLSVVDVIGVDAGE